ncbi:hypothetical protein L195_g061225, partial [Trifolium pratense]
MQRTFAIRFAAENERRTSPGAFGNHSLTIRHSEPSSEHSLTRSLQRMVANISDPRRFKARVSNLQ